MVNYTAQVSTRSGRRPGTTQTRNAIAASARQLFSERGYDRVSLRAIAADARVDPALVVHFFGSKEQLFLSVVEFPFEPGVVLPELLAGDPRTVGRRFAEFVVGTWEDPSARARLIAIVRAAASEPRAAAVLRELVSRQLVGTIAGTLGAADAELRATLVGSQIVGLAMARYVIGVEPLASVEPDRLVELIAPTLQRYLVEPL